MISFITFFHFSQHRYDPTTYSMLSSSKPYSIPFISQQNENVNIEREVEAGMARINSSQEREERIRAQALLPPLSHI